MGEQLIAMRGGVSRCRADANTGSNLPPVISPNMGGTGQGKGKRQPLTPHEPARPPFLPTRTAGGAGKAGNVNAVPPSWPACYLSSTHAGAVTDNTVGDRSLIPAAQGDCRARGCGRRCGQVVRAHVDGLHAIDPSLLFAPDARRSACGVFGAKPDRRRTIVVRCACCTLPSPV